MTVRRSFSVITITIFDLFRTYGISFSNSLFKPQGRMTLIFLGQWQDSRNSVQPSSADNEGTLLQLSDKDTNLMVLLKYERLLRPENKKFPIFNITTKWIFLKSIHKNQDVRGNFVVNKMWTSLQNVNKCFLRLFHRFFLRGEHFWKNYDKLRCGHVSEKLSN